MPKPTKPAKPTAKAPAKPVAAKSKPATGAVAKAKKPATGAVAKPPAAPAKKVETKRIEARKAMTPVMEPAIPAPAARKKAEAPRALVKRLEPAPAPTKQEPSPFAKGELAEWRSRLIKVRTQYSDDIQGLHQDAMEAEDGHTTPNHIAERGSDADMQDVALNIAGDEKNTLWLIDRAIRKIDTGRPLAFGLCEYTRQPIGRNRLDLMPWTPLSIEGAQYCEDSGQHPDDVLLDD